MFHFTGNQLNNTAVGEGTAQLLAGRTLTFATKPVAAFPLDNQILTSGALSTTGASARIFATGRTVSCSAALVDKVGNPPVFATMLPIFSTLRQSGQ